MTKVVSILMGAYQLPELKYVSNPKVKGKVLTCILDWLQREKEK
jgi:hypothetical protein